MIDYMIYPGLRDDEQRAALLITMPQIAEIVADHCKVELYEMVGTSRKREFVEARQIAMYFIRRKTKMKLKDIASFFKRDHSSVIYALDTVGDLFVTDKKFKAKVLMIERIIDYGKAA